MSDYSKAYYQANKDKWKKDYDKDKQNALNNKTKQRNRKFVNDYKLKNGCKICGYNKSSSSLHFHHRDPSTKIDAVARLSNWSYGLDTIKEEMDKCDLLCANCHGELHEAQK